MPPSIVCVFLIRPTLDLPMPAHDHMISAEHMDYVIQAFLIDFATLSRKRGQQGTVGINVALRFWPAGGRGKLRFWPAA